MQQSSRALVCRDGAGKQRRSGLASGIRGVAPAAKRRESEAFLMRKPHENAQPTVSAPVFQSGKRARSRSAAQVCAEAGATGIHAGGGRMRLLIRFPFPDAAKLSSAFLSGRGAEAERQRRRVGRSRQSRGRKAPREGGVHDLKNVSPGTATGYAGRVCPRPKRRAGMDVTRTDECGPPP